MCVFPVWYVLFLLLCGDLSYYNPGCVMSTSEPVSPGWCVVVMEVVENRQWGDKAELPFCVEA